jgi:RNA polymerase sigma factor (sigma-70 family)
MQVIETIIQDLYKTEYRKIVSVLCKHFGIEHIEIAEDIATDAFIVALEKWQTNGLPENPNAWLYTVAKNKAKDHFKRDKILQDKILPQLITNASSITLPEPDFSEDNINDSELNMIFAICSPVLSRSSQIALGLKILFGLGIGEIASAFLTNKETINKKLFRAKEKLKEEEFKIEKLSITEISTRLESVLMLIYLIFNEGYYSMTKNSVIHKKLCIEAMQLNLQLIESKATNVPKANALMSLMCFHASRFDARIDESGYSILYEDQSRELWNEELIAKGNYYLIKSAQGQELSRYHLEASIAYWHCSKIEHKDKWENILQLYNRLLQIYYSPMTALNRTYAISRARGKEIAIHEAEKLKLKSNHLYFSLLGNLYTDIDNTKAKENYSKALELARTDHDKQVLKNHISKLT